MQQNKILVITSIIPTSFIKNKKDENDILLITENYLKQNNPQIEMEYLFIIPKVNWFISLISMKWKSYYKLNKQGCFYAKNKKIHVLPIYILPFKNSKLRYFLCWFSLLTQKKRIERLLRSWKPKLVHTHNVNIDSILGRIFKNRYKLPYVMTFRGNQEFDRTIFKNLYSANQVITLTYNDKELLENKANVHSVVIPHGISDDFFTNTENYLHSIKDKKMRIVTISRLLDWKNIGGVIQSLSRVNFDFEYTIYGDGPEFETLASLIKTYDLQNKVFLKGRIPHDEIKDKLKEHNIFILMSYPETFGRVFLEAIASGLPIIGHEGIGIESFFYDKKAGVFTNFDNLEYILADLSSDFVQLENMSMNAKKLALEFKWDNIAKKINDVYENNESSF